MSNSKTYFQHLEDIKQTYHEHLVDTFKYSLTCFGAGFIFLIHGFIPDIFVFDGSNMIAELHNTLTEKKKKLELLNKKNY